MSISAATNRLESTTAASVLSIQHARLKLRRDLIAALAADDKRAAQAISLARDTLARIEADLKRAGGEVTP